jgi:hypothetical protein
VQELEQLQSNVIFYANEKGKEKKPTHPLADLFFRTNDGELVLFDVSGGRAKAAKKQNKRLTKWIESWHSMTNKKFFTTSTLHGVVLAPATAGCSSVDGNVQVVRGKDAQRLLPGGLCQVYRWVEG